MRARTCAGLSRRCSCRGRRLLAAQAAAPQRAQPTRTIRCASSTWAPTWPTSSRAPPRASTPGQFATFGQKRFWITATNAKYARLALEGQPLALGDEGRVRVPQGEDQRARLCAPTPIPA